MISKLQITFVSEVHGTRAGCSKQPQGKHGTENMRTYVAGKPDKKRTISKTEA